MKTKKAKWYVLVGGGSGGHVLPLKIITEKLLEEEKGRRVLIITDYRYYARTAEILVDVRSRFGERLVVKKVSSGKFRRYSRGWQREILDLKMQLLNLRDLLKMLVGFLQSKIILLKYKPGVIFCKGGSSALEFCLAARRKAPIIVHDSDSRPGLANKIVGRYAKVFMTGMPKSASDEDLKKAVGVPVDDGFKNYSAKEIGDLKKKLSLDAAKKIILVTGGGLGAVRINRLIFKTIEDLTKLNITVLHQTGRAEETALAEKAATKLKLKELYRPFDFSSEMPDLYAVADVVVARAGATTIQELANAKKPGILIPAKLTDQVKNGQIIKEMGAAIVLDGDELEANPESLVDNIELIFEDQSVKKVMLEALKKLEKRDVVNKIVIKLNENYLK